MQTPTPVSSGRDRGTFLRNHDFGWAFEPREDRREKDEAGVTSVDAMAVVDTCVMEGVEERGGVEISG